MATRKAASTKKATARKPAAAKTTVRTVSASTKKPTTVSNRVVARPAAKKKLLPGNIINVVLAELFGTFILTLVLLTSASDTSALYAGLAMTVLILSLGAISGAHLNPAVTFGFWSMRRLKSILLPFYWVSQLLGAVLAVVVSAWVARTDINLDFFSHFTQFDWQIFGIELVGTAVFLFGWAAVANRVDLSNLGKALGVGTSLLAALVVAGTLYSAAYTAAVSAYQADSASNSSSNPELRRVLYVKGPVLNPAASLAVSENTKSYLLTGSNGTDTVYSHLSLDVIVGTLVGAALGGNLYLLIAGRLRKNA